MGYGSSSPQDGLGEIIKGPEGGMIWDEIYESVISGLSSAFNNRARVADHVLYYNEPCTASN